MSKLHIRTTKTYSGSTAVQVVRYVNRKLEVMIHIGSGKTEEEILKLKLSASDRIERNDRQLFLFSPSEESSSSLVALDKCEYLDLKIRPICHFKKYSIEDHILICSMALAIEKYIELKTNLSIKQGDLCSRHFFS